MEGGGGDVDRGAILDQTEVTDIRKQRGGNVRRIESLSLLEPTDVSSSLLLEFIFGIRT